MYVETVEHTNAHSETSYKTHIATMHDNSLNHFPLGRSAGFDKVHYNCDKCEYKAGDITTYACKECDYNTYDTNHINLPAHNCDQYPETV